MFEEKALEVGYIRGFMECATYIGHMIREGQDIHKFCGWLWAELNERLMLHVSDFVNPIGSAPEKIEVETDLAKILEKEAQSRGVSASQLVSELAKKFMEAHP